MSNQPTVEDLRRLRADARGNTAAYMAAWNQASQATREELLRAEGTR